MQLGLFDDFEIDEILAIQQKAKTAVLGGGSVVTSWTSEGVSLTKLQGMSLHDILAQCRHSLRKKDPATYGRSIKRTKPNYRFAW